MAHIFLRDGTRLGTYERPYIVAEVNSSHNGSIETARAMIAKAKEIGCSCVKFQSWSPDSLYAKTYYQSNPIAQRIVKKFSLAANDLKALAEFCREIGIAFSSTPYSRAEVDFLLEECHSPYVKIASMEINNHAFLKYIAGTGAPIILSTGMADMDEVKKAVSIIEDAGNDKIVLLHCISIYPAEPKTIRLLNIPGLRKEFPKYPIGFSDHTFGTEMSAAATALGAAVIEKHFSLDKSKMGMDNNMATEPEEFARLIRGCLNVFEAIGDETRIVSEAEYEQRKKMRRSIIAAKDLRAGTELREGDLDSKRPGNGIPPDRLEMLYGRTLKRDVNADALLVEEDLET